jgi:2-polyprenyl-3-methyl-5-hydroxy-6-metoxy-1,4-benzoquinol methylase
MTVLGRRKETVDLVLQSGPQNREYEAIARRIAADRPGRVLDWGCGWGQISDMMIRAGLQVTSFEYDETVGVPTVAPLERFPHIRAHRSPEPVALPFEDDTFDAVLGCGVLEHVKDPDGSLDELRRVLRPGGTLYVYKLPNRLSYLEWIARRIGIYHHGVGPFDKLYTLAEGRALIERHGYEIAESRHANMLPLTLQGKLAARLAGAIWALSSAIARVPVLNRLATNVEYVARSRR